MAINKAGLNKDYDEINDGSTHDEKLNVAINIIRNANGPTILNYNKLKISLEDEKLFDVKLKKTGFVTFTQDQTAYHPTYFISDDGYLKLEEHGSFLNYTNFKKVNENDDLQKNKISISDFLSNNIKPFVNSYQFIHKARIGSLEKIKNANFDLSKLLLLCKEINDNYELKNYYSVGILTRTILDHIPPILGQKSFADVANQYGGGSSFKTMMQHLDRSNKNIGNLMLHSQIKFNETLPNENTIECRTALDTLLGELIDKLTI